MNNLWHYKSSIFMVYFYVNAVSKKVLKSLLIFVFVLVSHSTISAQTNIDDAAAKVLNSQNIGDNVAAASSTTTINFVLWFMGTKQEPIIKIPSEYSNLKKQMIMSGRAPNRLLMKAFLKKVINLDTMIS